MNPQRLLRDTSRSFSLSIRWLPRAVRDSIRLGYLLARASDSIADTSGAPLARRVEALHALRSGDIGPRILEEIAGYQKPDAERDLVAALPDLLDLLEVSPDRAVIETVWEKILEGQIFDLVRFNHSDDPLSPEELDEYTYLVAGSVGEFWSNLCADRLPGFSTMDRESHAALAVSYGKGLQRVNILRDWADDLLHGRRYLAAGRFEPEKSLAESQLISGLHWVAAVRVGRVRFSTVLPARLGLEMLPHLHEGSPKVKLTRQLVRRQLFAALPLLWRCSDGAQPMAAESRLDVRS